MGQSPGQLYQQQITLDIQTRHMFKNVNKKRATTIKNKETTLKQNANIDITKLVTTGENDMQCISESEFQTSQNCIRNPFAHARTCAECSNLTTTALP